MIFACVLQPIQARAFLPALALLAPETLGLAMAGTAAVGAAAAYYAPALYEAGQNAVVNGSDYAHKAWAVYSFLDGLGRQVLYGKAVEAYNSLENLGEWIGNNLPQVPAASDAYNSAMVNQPTAIGQIRMSHEGNVVIMTSDPINVGLQPLDEINDEWMLTEFSYRSAPYAYWNVPYNDTYSLLYKIYCTPTSDSVTDTGTLSIPTFAQNLTAAPDQSAISDDMQKAFAGTPATTTFKDADTTTAAPAAAQYTEITPAEYDEFQQNITNNYYQTSVTTIQTLADADPTNTALQAQLEQAKIMAAQGINSSIADDAQTVEVSLTDPVEIADETDMPSVPAVSRIELDFSPLLALQDQCMTRFPFTLFASVAGMFDYLVATPVAPSISWSWAGHQSSISFSVCDNLALTLRVVMAALFHASIIYAIIRRWS